MDPQLFYDLMISLTAATAQTRPPEECLWQVWKGGSLWGRLIVRRQLLLYGNGD